MKNTAEGSEKSAEHKQPPLTDSMKALLDELRVIVSNPVVEAAYNEAVSNVQAFVNNNGPEKNPWAGTTVDYFVDYFKEWFTFLPSPTDGLGKIVPLTWFYLNNKSAFYFLNTLESKSGTAKEYSKEIFNWSVKFVVERGEFMDAPDSAPDYLIKEWTDEPSTDISEYIIPHKKEYPPYGKFLSFNEFFTRKFINQKKSRPILDDADSIVVASGDTEINFIESELTLETPLHVKTRQINVNELLDKSEYANYFVGGTAVSCVLMPNSYHHYHAPVSGDIVESKDIPGIYNGIMDGEDWFNRGDIGESTTDFSIFEDFHRAYYIIKTKSNGYVAIIPVGLNTISKIVTLNPYQSKMVSEGEAAKPVNKGDELGNFAYGGSLNILLFEANVFSSVSALMGQRLGQMSVPKRLSK